jgi:hypothetical protein
MFGAWFYHQRIRKSVAAFGALFNNLYIIRKNSNGNVVSSVKVPLAYAPRRKYLERIRENPSLLDNTKIAIKLPRMSFEIVGFQYDTQRQVSKTNRLSTVGSDNGTRALYYAGTPYLIFFSLSIYAKSHDDALQVVEQILPYFNPQYSLTVKPFENYSDVKEDIPITITSASFSDDYESSLEDRRTIIYTLEFEMKTMFYGPIGDSKIIREVQNNFYLIGPDSDSPVSRYVITPDPIDVSPDSDYGFDVEKIDFIG